jgi:acetylglutamate synthase
MSKLLKVLVLLCAVFLLSCGSVFATNIDISIESEKSLQDHIFNITVDGNILSSSTYDAKTHTVHVKSSVNIEHRPYDIIIEHIKDKQSNKYEFKAMQMSDLVLRFKYDGKNLTPTLY